MCVRLTANPLILATLANPAQPSAAIQQASQITAPVAKRSTMPPGHFSTQAGPTAAEEVDSNLIAGT